MSNYSTIYSTDELSSLTFDTFMTLLISFGVFIIIAVLIVILIMIRRRV